MEGNGSGWLEGGQGLGGQGEGSRRFFCLQAVGSLGSLVFSLPFTRTELWGIPSLPLLFDHAFSFSGVWASKGI